jgi:hypothetical protein
MTYVLLIYRASAAGIDAPGLERTQRLAPTERCRRRPRSAAICTQSRGSMSRARRARFGAREADMRSSMDHSLKRKNGSSDSTYSTARAKQRPSGVRRPFAQMTST